MDFITSKELLQATLDDIARRPVGDLGLDPSLPRRPRVPDAEREIWDSMRFAGHVAEQQLNEHPHCTLSFRPDWILAVLILPNRWMKAPVNRDVLCGLGLPAFRDLIGRMTQTLAPLSHRGSCIRPWILVQQRRATAGQTLDAQDAELRFDPRTAFDDVGDADDTRPIKTQPEWLDAAYRSITNMNANLEFACGARIGYDHPAVREGNAEALGDLVTASWTATLPLLDVVVPSRRPVSSSS